MQRALHLLGVLWLVSDSALAQTRKPTGAEWDQVRPLFALVEQVAAGKPPPAEVTLTWQCHFVNAEAGVVFVPFTVTVAQGELTSFPIAMYLRVVARGAPAPAPGPRDALAQYPFEDAAIFEGPAEGRRITRAFTAPPGQYDVYIALTERPNAGQVPPKTAVLKQPVNIPDFQSGLSVSSIIVAEKILIDPSNRRPTFEEQLDDPYVLWGTRVTPATTSTFGRSRNLSLTFLIYNVTAAGGDKPDVEVQYAFHRKTAAGDTFFTRTNPELFNAETLGPGFSLTAGDLIIGGQEMPLSRFPDGEYRLEITVTDKTGAQSITRNVHFVVAGP